MSFSNKDLKMVDQGLDDRQDLNLSVPELTRGVAQSARGEKGSKKICFCFKSKQIKTVGLLILENLEMSWDFILSWKCPEK